MQPDKYKNRVLLGRFCGGQEVYLNEDYHISFDLPFSERYMNELYADYPGLRNKKVATINEKTVKSYRILNTWQYVEYAYDLSGGYARMNGPAEPLLFTYYHVEIVPNEEYGPKYVIQIDSYMMNYLIWELGYSI